MRQMTIPLGAQIPGCAGFCREFAGSLPRICREFAGNLPGICRAFAGRLPGICREFVGNLPGDSREFAGKLPAICREFVGCLLGVCREFAAGNLPGVRRKFALSPKAREQSKMHDVWLLRLFRTGMPDNIVKYNVLSSFALSEGNTRPMIRPSPVLNT